VVLDYDFLLHHLRLEHSTNMAKYGSEHMTEEAGALVLEYAKEDMVEELETKVEQLARDLLKGNLRLEGTKITAMKRGSSPLPTSSMSLPCSGAETRITAIKKTSSTIPTSTASIMSTIAAELNKQGYA